MTDHALITWLITTHSPYKHITSTKNKTRNLQGFQDPDQTLHVRSAHSLCQTTETSVPPTHQPYFRTIGGLCTNSSIFSKRLPPLAESWPFFQTQVGCHFYRESSLVTPSLFFFYCLFIYLVALGLSCSTQDPQFSLWHARSSSLTRDRTPDPCIGSIES